MQNAFSEFKRILNEVDQYGFKMIKFNGHFLADKNKYTLEHFFKWTATPIETWQSFFIRYSGPIAWITSFLSLKIMEKRYVVTQLPLKAPPF